MTRSNRCSGRWLAALTGALVTALIAACSSTIDGTAQPPDNSPAARPTTGTPFDYLLVGQLQQVWAQSTSAYAEATVSYADTHPQQLLLADQAAYDAWLADLPDAMLAEASKVSLDEQVAVVGHYGKCMEQSAVFHLGAGQLVYDVWVAEEDEGTSCAWSPIQIELWVIDLTDLDVDSAADVTLGY